MVASQLKNLAKTQIMNLNRYNRFNMSIKSSVEFLNQYPNANKFLVRYFPINLIYYYMTTDFVDFMKILNEDNFKSDLIWNKNMLESLVTSLKNSCEKALFENSLNFDDKLKVDYTIITERKLCFLYYLDIYVDKKSLSEERLNKSGKMKLSFNKQVFIMVY